MVLGIILIGLIIFICPEIIGLILSIIGMCKKINGFNIAGISLNIVALVLYIFRIFLFYL